jgi:hypothetical protein
MYEYFMGLESHKNTGKGKLPENRASDAVMLVCGVSLYPRIRPIIRARGVKTVA